MRCKKIGILALASYLAIYLWVVVPIHSAHANHHLPDRTILEHQGTDAPGDHHHRAGFCPVCQVAGGLIHLPSTVPDFEGAASIQPLVLTTGPLVLGSLPSPTTSRAPPISD